MTDDENRNQYFLARAKKRLKRDMKLITNDPIPLMDVALNEDDILDWHFLIHGREDTPYEDGMYHGRLVFPPTFPFGPPKILFLTPNGRFKVNERICFSLSDFHPEEWKPSYPVTAVLRGVYDFMHETTDTNGSIEATDSERRRLARASIEHNRLNTSFCKFFPQLCTEQKHETSPDEFIEIKTNTGQTISAHPSTENYIEAMDTGCTLPNSTDTNVITLPTETASSVENSLPDYTDTRTPNPLMETASSVENTLPDYPDTRLTPPLMETSSSVENTLSDYTDTRITLPLMETASSVENTLPDYTDTRLTPPLMETASSVENTLPDYTDTRLTPPLMETASSVENTLPDYTDTRLTPPLMETASSVENTLPDYTDTRLTPPLMETASSVENTLPDYTDTRTPNPLMETAPPIENTFPDFPNTRTPSQLLETAPPIENTFPDFPNIRTPSQLIETVPSIEWNKPLDSMDNLPMDSNSSNQVISHSMRSGNRIPSFIRGIIVPTGLVGNILPGEKYHTDYTILQINDNPDFNQFTDHPSNPIATNSSLGYSFIQNTPTCIEVSNIDYLYNNRAEVIIKTIKTHKDDSPIYPSIACMHKTRQKAGIEQVEEGKVFYSRPGIGLCQNRFNFVFFLKLIIAHKFVLFYFLTYLIIFE